MSRQCRTISHARLWRRRRTVVFNVAEARSALQYVACIVIDAVSAYHRAQACRAAIRESSDHRDRAAITDEMDAALAALNRATDDCDLVGVNLVDLDRGVVAFPASVDGRAVSLIWRVGQPIDGAWRDLDAIHAFAVDAADRTDDIEYASA